MSDEFDTQDLDDKKDDLASIDLDGDVAEVDSDLGSDEEDDASFALYDDGVEDGEYSY